MVSVGKNIIIWSSYLKVVTEDVLGQSVKDFMVTTEHLPALTSKAQCVDYTRFQVACQHVITRKYDTPSSHDGLLATLCFFLFVLFDFEPNIRFQFRSRENHPLPVKSELGGVLSSSHEYWLLSGSQPLSSRPSSQSWSPLHTRDRLMHWPAGFSFTVEA